MALMYTGDVKAKYAVKVSSSKCARRLVCWLVVVVALMVDVAARMVGLYQWLWRHQWLLQAPMLRLW